MTCIGLQRSQKMTHSRRLQIHGVALTYLECGLRSGPPNEVDGDRQSNSLIENWAHDERLWSVSFQLDCLREATSYRGRH